MYTLWLPTTVGLLSATVLAGYAKWRRRDPLTNPVPRRWCRAWRLGRWGVVLTILAASYLLVEGHRAPLRRWLALLTLAVVLYMLHRPAFGNAVLMHEIVAGRQCTTDALISLLKVHAAQHPRDKLMLSIGRNESELHLERGSVDDEDPELLAILRWPLVDVTALGHAVAQAVAAAGWAMSSRVYIKTLVIGGYSNGRFHYDIVPY